MFDTNIECKSINGVGGFKNIVLRKFVQKEVGITNTKDYEFDMISPGSNLAKDSMIFPVSPQMILSSY